MGGSIYDVDNFVRIVAISAGRARGSHTHRFAPAGVSAAGYFKIGNGVCSSSAGFDMPQTPMLGDHKLTHISCVKKR